MTLDLAKYLIFADISKYNDDVDFTELQNGHVEAVGIRINEDDGSLKMDPRFQGYWAAAKAHHLKRFVYLVVNPAKVNVQSYMDWLAANLPTDCTLVAPDVEISRIYCDATPKQWSDFLIAFIRAIWAKGLFLLDYSCSGFYPNVKPWPAKVDGKPVPGWFARYLNSMYPTAVVNGKLTAIHLPITWQALWDKLAALTWSPLVGLTEAQTGPIYAWQVASSYINPACQPGRPMDISLGIRVLIEPMFDGQDAPGDVTPVPTPLPEPTSKRYQVVNCYVAAVRAGPGTNYKTVDYITVRDPNTGVYQAPTYVMVYAVSGAWSAINADKTEWIGSGLLAAV